MTSSNIATPPPDMYEGVAPAIVHAVLKHPEIFMNCPPETPIDAPVASDDADSTSSGSDMSMIRPPVPRLSVIPQSLYRTRSPTALNESHDGTIPRIVFSLKKQVDRKHGVPMSLLVNDRERAVARALDGATDEVLLDLARSGVRSVKLRIAWPAYPAHCLEREIEIVYKGSSSQDVKTISRAVLAQKVANAFLSFVRLSPKLPLSDDPWEAGFRFGPGALSFADLWLVSLWQVDGNVFEAEVRHTRNAQG